MKTSKKQPQPPAKKTLHYAGYDPKAESFGWATCSHSLRRELGKLFTLTEANQPHDIAFIPILDHDLTPCTPLTGKVNVGYAFFESELGPKAKENAAKLDILFVGSTWCLERLKERGITNGRVLIQGVDQNAFYPRQRHADGQFRIFSGGKFEWRKGQDIVIAAFREFSRQYEDAHLVCSWWNPWPGLAIECATKAGLSASGSTLEEFYEDMLVRAGIPRHRFTILPRLNHEQLAQEMSNTDVGLFTNRCEGGTNLVLMEYLACGGRGIANTMTGHRDIAQEIDFHLEAYPDQDGWAVHNLKDINQTLRDVYVNKGSSTLKPPAITRFTWGASAQTVKQAIEELK